MLLLALLVPAGAWNLVGDSSSPDDADHPAPASVDQPTEVSARAAQAIERREPRPLPSVVDMVTTTTGVVVEPVPEVTESVVAPAPEEPVRTVRPEAAPQPVKLRLACAQRAESATVVCEWSTVDRARAYRLWRVADPGTGDARTVIAVVEAGAPPRHVDETVEPGHRYVYAVEAVSADGSSLGLSEPVLVEVGPRDHRLRMACELTTTDAGRGIGCRWSEADVPGAAGWLLWRSVDGGERGVIARIGLDERPGYLDREVAAGHSYRYVLQLVNAEGSPIGSSEPVLVEVGRDVVADLPPTTTEAPAPVEVEPVDESAADAPR